MEKKIYIPEYATCENCRHRPFKNTCTTMPSEAVCAGWGCLTGPPSIGQTKMWPGGFTEPILKWPEGAGEKPVMVDSRPLLIGQETKTPIKVAVTEETDVDETDIVEDEEHEEEPEVLICCLCESAECDGSKIIDDCAVCDKCYAEFSE